MDLERIFREEDMFPMRITSWAERPYGFLFYSESNKDSFDSNHAVIFRSRVMDLDEAVEDIVQFYSEKGIKPTIYQSISDDGYFAEKEDVLARHGFKCWTEDQKYMVLSEANTITPNQKIQVERVRQWNDDYAAHIFLAAEEPWEIAVAQSVISRCDTLFFVAYYEGIPVGMTYGHLADGVCRVDYLLVSKKARSMGVGRALICAFVEHCHAQRIETCYLWPDGDTAERIYHEAGFRPVAVKQAGRACMR